MVGSDFIDARPARAIEVKREQQTHDLKILPEWFTAVRDMGKRAEIRKDDRGYHTRDTLILREWSPERGYSGLALKAKVRHITRNVPGLSDGYAVLTIGDPQKVVRLD